MKPKTIHKPGFAPLKIILNYVSEKTGVSPDDIRGKARYREFVLARQCFCYLARTYTRYGTPTIGAYINRNHATVLHSCKETEINLEAKDEIGKHVQMVVVDFEKTNNGFKALENAHIISEGDVKTIKKKIETVKIDCDHRIARMYNACIMALERTQQQVTEDPVIEGYRREEIVRDIRRTKDRLQRAKLQPISKVRV